MDNVKLVDIDHVREKLIELLDKVQDSGVIDIPAGFGSTYVWIKNEKVADHLIANGVTLDKDESKISSKWIPVTERLPDEDVRVIVRIDRTVWNTTFELDADRRHNGDWVRWGRAVTDWMPMPEYAKGE